MSQAEFQTFCSDQSANYLETVGEIFKANFEHHVQRGRVSSNTQRTYSYALNVLVGWLRQEIWYKEQFPQPIQFMPKYQGVIQAPKGAYAIKESDLTSETADELISFKEFWMSSTRSTKKARRGGLAIRLSTFEKAKKEPILCFFGWLINFRGYLLDNLSLSLLLDLKLVEEYIDWRVDERKCSYASSITFTQVCISVAKFLHADLSRQPGARKRRNWSDVEIIEDLRDIRADCQDEYKPEFIQNQEEKWKFKEISHEQARDVVLYLKQLAAEHYHNGRVRHPSSVFFDFQRYLLVKILVFLPVRQEEILAWKPGQTLFREVTPEGKPYYRVDLSRDEHKRGSRTYKGRAYPLPDILTQDLDYWVNHCLPRIEQALQSEANWLEFWGLDLNKGKRLQQSLEDAERGKVSGNVRCSPEEYVVRVETKMKALERKINALENARENFASHEGLFILFGSKRYPESFGKPLNEQNFWALVTNGMKIATQKLFGTAKKTNPHAFRHIADKHVRQSGHHNIKAFDILLGHSERMGDAYARQILSEYEVTKDVVDDWYNSKPDQ